MALSHIDGKQNAFPFVANNLKQAPTLSVECIKGVLTMLATVHHSLGEYKRFILGHAHHVSKVELASCGTNGRLGSNIRRGNAHILIATRHEGMASMLATITNQHQIDW